MELMTINTSIQLSLKSHKTRPDSLILTVKLTGDTNKTPGNTTQQQSHLSLKRRPFCPQPDFILRTQRRTTRKRGTLYHYCAPASHHCLIREQSVDPNLIPKPRSHWTALGAGCDGGWWEESFSKPPSLSLQGVWWGKAATVLET